MWITLSYAKERNNLLIIMILIQSSSPNGQTTVSYFSTLLKYDFFDSTYLFFVAHKMDKERGKNTLSYIKNDIIQPVCTQ